MLPFILWVRHVRIGADATCNPLLIRNSLTPPQCKHCNYPPWIRLVTTMGFMFRSRIVAEKEISYRNAANTFDFMKLPSHYSQWLESCKHANTSCLETLSKKDIDSEYDIECLETCSVCILFAYKNVVWYDIIFLYIIMSWWSTILHTRLPILIPVTSFWCTKGTQDPLSFPTSPARPGTNPKSSRSKNCFWGSYWGTFHLPKVRQATGLSSKGKIKFVSLPLRPNQMTNCSSSTGT